MCAHEGPGPLESEPKEALLPNATYLAEAKDQLRIGVPVAFSAVIRRSMVVVTVAVVGRLGPDAMAAAALAVSATNTFALSVMVGLSSASTTLVSQAVGAKDSRQAGLWLHRALLVHAMAAVPLTLMLLCFGPLLLAMGQDVALSKSAGTYACVLVPGMWGWACMWALQPWLQAHGVVRVQTATSAVAALLHPCWLALLVGRVGLYGAAAAESIFNCLSVALLALAVVAPCLPLRAQLPMVAPCRASLARLPTFLRLGLPGVVMMFEWWASEINILASGLLPSPALALASLSVYQTVNAVCFMLPLGASVAGATRIGKALGRGDAAAARRAALVCYAVGVSFASGAAVLLLLLRGALPALFTPDADVRALVSTVLLPLALYVVADASQVCCGGVLQGCGRQRQGMPVVLVAYYVVGLPAACALGFGAGWGVIGMVCGMLAGKLLHAACFLLLVRRTDWEAEVRNAAKSVRGERDAAMAAAVAAGGDDGGDVRDGGAGGGDLTPGGGVGGGGGGGGGGEGGGPQRDPSDTTVWKERADPVPAWVAPASLGRSSAEEGVE